MEVQLAERPPQLLGVADHPRLLDHTTWFIANIVGGSEPLKLDPVNAWTATLILAVAIYLNRPRPELRQGEGIGNLAQDPPTGATGSGRRTCGAW